MTRLCVLEVTFSQERLKNRPRGFRFQAFDLAECLEYEQPKAACATVAHSSPSERCKRIFGSAPSCQLAHLL